MLLPRAFSRILWQLQQRNAAIGHRSLGPLRMKWLSGKDARAPEVSLGIAQGHPDNPELHTFDKPNFGTPDLGGKPLPQYVYRQPFPGRTYADYKIHYILTALLWYWFFYHMYYHSGHIFGHWYMPYLDEFTDEELGIPPDDAPDPEYWGNHYEEYGTYR